MYLFIPPSSREERRTYVAPSVVRLVPLTPQKLLNTFSLRGGFDDWELSQDEVEVVQDNKIEWWQ